MLLLLHQGVLQPLHQGRGGQGGVRPGLEEVAGHHHLLRFTEADAWRYQSAKELGGVDYWGKSAVYGGGGAVQKLHPWKNQSLAIIKELR